MLNKTKKVIVTGEAPVTGAPYSQAVSYGDLLFVSGQGPVDPKTGEVAYGSLEEQVRLVLSNLSAILEAGGASLGDVLKITVFLADMDDFESMNTVYKEYFKGDMPARTCIQADRLPFDIRVEIDAIACIPNNKR
ncbi:MAG: deaminase [Candidatus Methanogaster sp.]|uniref:Deaminase n=1 Tax=Candidatus Methanogaster sp. TaxID=3386292 RepID=A0AC61L4D1_9EURY|nr:MAG: deaminase [ANME-2 cluster archaeon]